MDATTSDSTGGLPPNIIDKKIMGANRRRHLNRKRPLKHIIRSTAKQHVQQHGTSACDELGLCEKDKQCNQNLKQHELRPHMEKKVSAALWGTTPGSMWCSCECCSSKVTKKRESWTHEAQEGRRLASASIYVPGDHDRLVRRPTLEREEAFRDPSTSKVRMMQEWSSSEMDEALVKSLYEMGLLYDKEAGLEATFNLDCIRHEEPLYSIRPSKRGRKAKKVVSHGSEQPLSLDLSFADLGEDERLTRFMSSLSSEVSAAHDERTQSSSARRSPPLRVIYELETSEPCVDVDTSQLPELTIETLSDYDCVSDSDMEDELKLREVHEDTGLETGTWIMLDGDEW